MRTIWMKAWMVAVAALCVVSCVTTDVDEVQQPADNGVKYEPLLVNLQTNVEETSDEDTRMMVGEITSSKVYYHWEERDSIGVLLLNVPTKDGNYCALAERKEEDHNHAKFAFEAMVPEGYEATDVDGFVYYPYNPSLIQAVSGSTGADYLTSGLSFRIPSVQTILPEEVGETACTRLMSRYGMACDLLACEGADGGFALQHQTAYFRFKVTADTEYANDNCRLLRLTARVGNREESTNDKGDVIYTLTDQVPIAGTYQLGLDYDEATFDGTEQVKLLSSGASTYVVSEFAESQSLAGPCYAFMALSPDKLWDAAANEGRYMEIEMQVEITTPGTDSDGNAIENKQVVSCTRYIPLSGRTVQRGGLYDVQMVFSAPLDTYTKLDANESANTYVIPVGGKYIFSAKKPGNGVLPYDTTWADLASAGISENLIEEGKTYGVNWLWSSGTLFGKYYEVDVLRECTVDVATKSITLDIAPYIPEEDWKGNMLLALYETNADGSFKQIVWSWLLWFSNPEDYHLYFPNTRPSVDINNSDWFIMDRNLGAEEPGLDVASTGLYFQQGRKDPFVGPSTRGTLTVTYTEGADSPVYVVENGDYSTTWTENQKETRFNTDVFGTSVASWQSGQLQSGEVYPHRYPAALFARTAEQMASPAQQFAWLHHIEQSATQTKTCFDPCPPGYKLPTTREWDNLKNNRYEFTTPAATGNGPFGYAHYHYNGAYAYPPYTPIGDETADWTWPNGTDGVPYTYYAYGEVKARCDAGEYYEVDYDNGESGYGTMGRTYHIGKMSLHGAVDITLPATGAITEAGVITGLDTNIVLWSSGRIDEVYNTFDGYWFGILGNGDTNYADNYQDWWGEWVTRIYSFYTPSLFTNPFGSKSAGLPNPTLYYDKAGGTGAVTGMSSSINYAAPVRCIRTYNSTAE